MTRTTTLAGLADQSYSSIRETPPKTLASQPLDLLLSVYDTLLDRFMPPLILIDQRRCVVDTFSDADQFLRFCSRRPSQDVVDLLLEPLRQPVADALALCFSTRQPVSTEAIELDSCPLGASGDRLGQPPGRLVFARITPVSQCKDDSLFFSITIEDAELSQADFGRSALPRQTYGKLAGATAMAVRESSETVPNIMPCQLDELINSSGLVAIFLDPDLRICGFNSSAGNLFGLLPHDVGREMRTFVGQLGNHDLMDRISQVAHTGDSDAFEIQTCQGRYYLARLVPWALGSGKDGVVVTLIDLAALEENRQQVNRLSSIVQHSADAIISRDCADRIVTWNAAAEELYGYSASEAIGKPASLIIPEDETEEQEAITRLMRREKPLNQFDVSRRTKAGELLRVSIRLSPIYDESNRIVGISTIERDISARVQLMERLTQSEKMLQAFYNHSPDMFCSFDTVTGVISDCNDCMCRQLGRTREEIIGRSILDLQTDLYRDKAAICLQRFRSTGMLQDQELELRRNDGSSVPISLSATALYDAGGRIIAARAMCRDISALRVKDELIRQGETRYRNSFQKSAIGIAHCDLNGRYLLANRRLCEIVGYSFDDLSLRTFCEITHPDDLDQEIDLRRRLIAGELDTYKLEKRYIHQSGREVWVSVFVSLERDCDGKPMACHSYVEDISARKELENELRVAIQQRDQFLAMLSHELRNPLGAILNTCAVLSRRKGYSKHVQSAVSIVTRQARQMAELLDDLLDVSRITTGKIKLEKAPVELAQIVDQAVESQQSLALSRGQRIAVTYCDDRLRVFGDASRLVQVVVNLLNNAIKYTGDGGSISVMLEKQGRLGRIRVRDNGVGLEPEQIESLFEMFAQKDATLDRSGGGMGLGLHLVRKLVNFHSGRVSGRSDGLGKGSEFIVEVPLSAKKQTGLQTEIAPRPKRGVAIKKIVVIEDIDDARNMLVALLEADDYQVTAAADGEAGLQLILRERPDLAIVDIGLPKIDGYEVARRVRQQIPPSELRLIALTGYGQDSDYENVMKAGFDTHLVKPLNHTRLEKILAGM
jgi:PAS domain S-box-containing protein